ncbi:hypothetical protein JXB02_00905 [Candidatus Woesearchaeota archaeon]|nr:hypothetical protein [Candidatus Woesearchaeota archaeon]
MRIPKRYGESRIDRCPFCGVQATAYNSQGMHVCARHTDALLGDMKCLCGEALEMRSGKWGVYFSCPRCGNVNSRRVFETNQAVDVSVKKKAGHHQEQDPGPKEIIVRSDDPYWCG